jgi:DtxR family Mn-dependent transcriptional regulator
LWESYLADRTGVDESQWHDAADQKEHTLTDAQVEELSVRLGDPAFDPHGDPIPRADGSMPSRRGIPLSNLEAGESARVVQMGDKPAAVYDQLVAARLFPGVTVRVIDKSPDRIQIDAQFREHVLAPVVAANLAVEPIGRLQDSRVPDARLSSLRVGQEATVQDISPACRGLERRRLLDLGMVPGTKIQVEFASISGDPLAYRVRGALIALRSEQAELVHVTQEPVSTTNSLPEDLSRRVGPL